MTKLKISIFRFPAISDKLWCMLCPASYYGFYVLLKVIKAFKWNQQMVGKSENVKNLNFVTKTIYRKDKKNMNRGSECGNGLNIEPCHWSLPLPLRTISGVSTELCYNSWRECSWSKSEARNMADFFVLTRDMVPKRNGNDHWQPRYNDLGAILRPPAFSKNIFLFFVIPQCFFKRILILFALFFNVEKQLPLYPVRGCR